MKVSVLMPSRGRPELAKKSIESLGKGDFEILVYLDHDDPEFYNYRLKGCRVSAGGRHGYGGLHNYYNLLSAQSSGDWLMLWNDDATMETKNWVDIISKYDHTIPQVLNPWNESGDNLFPLISRKWYEIVGHYSRSPHADSWVQQIGQRLNLQVYVPGIRITHLGEEMHDQTHNEVRQIVRQTSAIHRNMEKERIEDADKIRRWYEENQSM